MVVQDTDRYGRTVGRVYVGNLDVNAEMIGRGAAWVYRDYAKDPSLYRLENEAKAAKRGLWALPEAQRCAPWVWRIGPNLQLESHTRLRTQASECLLDAQGRVFIATSLGLGLVHSLDVPLAADAIASGVWQVQEVEAQALPKRYGYVCSPANGKAEK